MIYKLFTILHGSNNHLVTSLFLMHSCICFHSI